MTGFTLQPHPYRFPMGGVSETRKALSFEGALPFGRKCQESPVLLETPNTFARYSST